MCITNENKLSVINGQNLEVKLNEVSD